MWIDENPGNSKTLMDFLLKENKKIKIYRFKDSKEGLKFFIKAKNYMKNQSNIEFRVVFDRRKKVGNDLSEIIKEDENLIKEIVNELPYNNIKTFYDEPLEKELKNFMLFYPKYLSFGKEFYKHFTQYNDSKKVKYFKVDDTHKLSDLDLGDKVLREYLTEFNNILKEKLKDLSMIKLIIEDIKLIYNPETLQKHSNLFEKYAEKQKHENIQSLTPSYCLAFYSPKESDLQFIYENALLSKPYLKTEHGYVSNHIILSITPQNAIFQMPSFFLENHSLDLKIFEKKIIGGMLLLENFKVINSKDEIDYTSKPGFVYFIKSKNIFNSGFEIV